MSTKDIYENIEYLALYNALDTNINNVTIDTRKIKLNDCYIGIKGEKNDGNKFYMDAFNKGATIVILDNYEYNENDIKYLQKHNKMLIVVPDSIKALGSLAKFKRSKFKNPVIAITGSAGKTSTKDMVYSVLNKKYNAHKTIGNQNNHIGLPLSILSLDETNEILVLEMGMNHLKEISYLTDIARPDVAIITNVGTAHIGNLGNRSNILKAKLEILEGLNDSGNLIINNDNDLLHRWYLKYKDKYNYNIITIGINNNSDFIATDIKMKDNSSIFYCKGEKFIVPIGGEHFIYNALVAIATSSIFNVSVNLIREGIKDFELSANRMSITNKDDILIIDDSYNANYDSMSYAIKYLGNLDGRLIAVLGTMKELGDFSEELHRNLGKLIVTEEINVLITVGDYAKYINEEAINQGFNANNSYHFNNNKDAINLLKKIITANDKVLIKASNSLNFKEIVDAIKGEI